MRKNALILMAAGALVLMTATSANATYKCTTENGVTTCGVDRGVAPENEWTRDRRDPGDRNDDSGKRGEGRDSDTGGSDTGNDSPE